MQQSKSEKFLAIPPFLMPSSKNHTLSKSAAKSTAFSSIGFILQSFNMQISTPCFARVSGFRVVYSEITDCGKSEQNPASCYYLLVVKLVVKVKGLLLRGFTNFTSAWTVNVLFRISNSPIINIISFIS